MITTFFDRKTEFEDEVSHFLGRRIIEHKFMRRLAGVSFLGLLNDLADIPDNCRYSRYDHTLAVTHLTLRICRNLSIPDLETILSLISALVHDIGHGPLSHSAESIRVNRTGYRHSHQNAQRPSKVTSLIRDCYYTFPNILRREFTDEEKLAQAVYDLAEGRHAINNKWRIFNTPLCPDTFDGDNRACHSLNTSQRLSTYLNMTPLSPDQLVDAISSCGRILVVGADEASLLQKFDEQRFKLYDKVFYSTRLRAAEAMLVRAMEIAFSGRKKIEFTNLTDEKLISELQQKSVSTDLWERIRERRLFVPLSSRQKYYDRYKSALNKFPGVYDQGPTFIQAKQELESALAEQFGVSSELVILSSDMPLDWGQDKLRFESEGDTGMLKVNLGITQGLRSYKNKIIEIYVPEEVL